MYESLTQRLATVPDDTILYPGHLYSAEPSASMGETRERNYVFRISGLDQWRASWAEATEHGRQRVRIDAPPSTGSTTFVTYLASGPARNATARAMSHPSPVTPSDVRPARFSAAASMPLLGEEAGEERACPPFPARRC